MVVLNIRTLALLSAGLAVVAAPGVLGLHTPENPPLVTDTGFFEFSVPIGTPVWWWHNDFQPGGQGPIGTGLAEVTKTYELRVGAAPVVIEAEAFPLTGPDTPSACIAQNIPSVNTAPTTVVHGAAPTYKCAAGNPPPCLASPTTCPVGLGVKANGYTVQVHYFPWTTDATDPDHVISPTPATPLATNQWRADLVTTSYKTATISPSQGAQWQVWIDPAVGGVAYKVRARAYSTAPFFWDDIGVRGCVFYSSLNDQALVGCPDGYN